MSPLIVTIDNLLSREEVSSFRDQILTGQQEMQPAGDYLQQKETFALNAEEQEDAFFRFVVEQSGVEIPEEFSWDAIESFTYVVNNACDSISEKHRTAGIKAMER